MNKNESKYFNTALLMDEALLILLETKEFEFITVKEICLKAGVNRSTFYLHYQNVNELLIEAIEMINKRFYESFNIKKFDVSKASKDESFFITLNYLIPYLNFVKDNKRVFKLIHDKPEIFGSKKLTEYMYKNLFSPILDKYKVKENEKEYVFTFFTQGTLSIVLRWVSKGCIESVEDLANIIIGLIGYEIQKD